MINTLYRGKAARSAFLVSFAMLVLMFQSSASAKGSDCTTCHAVIVKGKSVHAAVQMGCESCHTGIDASDVPHRKTGKIAKGLSAAMPDLCYGCHDKKAYSGKKHVHAAVGMGCTGCHNPHSSNNPKLLLAEMPDLCYTCHEKKKFAGKFIHAPVGIGLCTSCHSPHQSDNGKLLSRPVPDLCFQCHEKKSFSKKNVHIPVAGGLCLDCHGPHGAEEFALLKKEPVEMCLGCHADVRKRPHAVAGFETKGHSIGLLKKGKPINDPARPGKRFYCGSCHNPHSSDSVTLFRYQAGSAMGLCMFCHKM